MRNASTVEERIANLICIKLKEEEKTEKVGLIREKTKKRRTRG